MSLTFTKLFSSITESTVWCEPNHVRIMWITMLAMADRRGRVWGSVPGLANRARVSVEEARDAITRFLSPDPDSRTPDHEGRRVEPIDGGWLLLNHEKYRAIRDEESIKESKRNYINAKRAEERKAKGVENVELGRDNAEADTESDTEAESYAEPDSKALKTTKAKVKNTTHPAGAFIRPDDCPQQAWDDWLKARKVKRLPNTATAWAGFMREVEKARTTASLAIQTCAERGWGGFRADWEVKAGKVNMEDEMEAFKAMVRNQEKDITNG